MRAYILFLVILAGIALAGCDQEQATDSDTPIGGATPPPESVFRFYVGNDKWIPEGAGDAPFYILYNEITGKLLVEARRELQGGQEVDQTLSIEQPDVGVGLYLVEEDQSFFIDRNNCGEYRPDATINDPFLKISRIDWADNHMAGSFELPMVNPDCPDTLIITKGVFSAVYMDW